jgi:hypothetical protein
METDVREPEGHHKKEVQITIDNKIFEVHPGEILVAQLKRLAGISPSYDLEQIADGKLIPLKDDQCIDIKRGEKFVSHPPAGASS